MAAIIVDREVLGRRLYLLRHAQRWALREVQARTAIPTSTLSRWERGHGDRYPELDRLAVLAELYGVTVAELLGPDWSIPGQVNTGPRRPRIRRAA